MTLMTTFPIPCAPRLRRFKDNRDNRDNIFSLLAHLSRVDRRWAVDGRFPPLNQPQHSTPLHKGRGKQPRGLRGGGALGLWLMAARGRGFGVVAYGCEGEGL